MMLKYGAESINKLGIGSDDEDDIISYFNTWKKDMWTSLVRAFGNSSDAKVTEINPATLSLGPGAMEEEANPNLSDVKRKLPYECIMTSFKTEKKLADLNKDSSSYDFKFRNWLRHDTLRILNVTELRDHPTEDTFTCLMELLLPKT
jgi:hypothetical protein